MLVRSQLGTKSSDFTSHNPASLNLCFDTRTLSKMEGIAKRKGIPPLL
jgi:hypothetical protein